ncbi:MAG TPA: lysophospholipid acyltransferase family protein [Acidisphaera sp.]|nr:lysophospholipid acyltransferase family protein [Acidisphaera sp.]
MHDRPKRLRRIAPLLRRNGSGTEAEGWPLTAAEQRRIVRKMRALRRIAMVLLWTCLAIPVQAVLIVSPGRPKVDFARFYWATVARLLGVRVRVIGARVHPGAMEGDGKRPVLFVSNHSSWLDIPVLGGRLPACFVSKDEVGTWPVIRTIARLGRTVYVSRNRRRTAEEAALMRGRLADGDNILLFPEGTSSDGSRVLPFRSAFFAIADAPTPDAPRPIIQPVSIVYDRMGWLPTERATRTVFAWYGDMNLAAHFWYLAQLRGMRATVLLHTPIDPAHYPSRKALAQAVWKAVADGAAALRQNRPAHPLAPEPVLEEDDGSEPAFA